MQVSRRLCLNGIGMSLLLSRLQATEDEAIGIGALTDGSGMVRIPPGEFSMGAADGNPDEGPVHRVRISRAFEIGKFEVTQAQWETVLADAHPRPGVPLLNSQGAEVSRKPSHFKGPSLPVESVSWDDVQLFLARLNERDPKHSYRLPTEAEWEYAAKHRAALETRAWYKDNSGESTHLVGQKQANATGLFDMDGNVAEWVHDWYGHEYYDETPLADPQGPRTGSYRVFRGGSWLDDGQYCRPTFRRFDFPVNRFYNVGFRVVRTARTDS